MGQTVFAVYDDASLTVTGNPARFAKAEAKAVCRGTLTIELKARTQLSVQLFEFMFAIPINPQTLRRQYTKIPKEGSLDDSLAAVLKERAEALIILPYPPFGLRNSRRS
jgi:hypothetical protein